MVAVTLHFRWVKLRLRLRLLFNEVTEKQKAIELASCVGKANQILI